MGKCLGIKSQKNLGGRQHRLVLNNLSKTPEIGNYPFENGEIIVGTYRKRIKD